MSSFEQKRAAMRALLDTHGLDALVLQRASSFAWATDGKSSYINTASSTGEATLVVTQADAFLITNGIEAPRLEFEEQLKAQGWEFKVGNYFEPDPTLAALIDGRRVGCDGFVPGAKDLSAEISSLRVDLTPEEGERFRQLGRMCAGAMDAACREIRPGMSEYEIAAVLGAESQRRGAQPVVNLIATDERIFAYRHPLPTAKKLEKYAMLILCGRWMGLVASITRLVHFGPLPEEVRQKAEACARVDAAVITGTRPGKTLGQIFAELQQAYAKNGFEGEWRLHHQGGPAAYEPRETIAVPGHAGLVKTGQAYAWNPSITGTKMEDTILVGENGNEVLTAIPGWPVIQVETPDGIMERPGIYLR